MFRKRSEPVWTYVGTYTGTSAFTPSDIIFIGKLLKNYVHRSLHRFDMQLMCWFCVFQLTNAVTAPPQILPSIELLKLYLLFIRIKFEKRRCATQRFFQVKVKVPLSSQFVGGLTDVSVWKSKSNVVFCVNIGRKVIVEVICRIKARISDLMTFSKLNLAKRKRLSCFHLAFWLLY